MRDGIFKNLPMARHWRSFAKACQRESERGIISNQIAERAIELDAHREVTSEFIRQFRNLICEASESLPGFGPLASIFPARDIGGQNSPLESEILSCARTLEDEGMRGEGLGIKAISEALSVWSISQARNIENHCFINNVSPKTIRPILDEVNTSLSKVDRGAIATRIMRDLPPPSRRIRKPIDLDNDDLAMPR